VARAYTWEQLAALTLARQFPRVWGRGEDAVVDVVGRTGPIQSQAARAPYLSLAARLPGVSRAAVNAGHESLRVVRSTSLRGTVHTSTREQHAKLAAVAAPTFVPWMRRLMALDDDAIHAFRAEVERLAAEGWTHHETLQAGVVAWLESRGLRESIASLGRPGGRYSIRNHPPMLRRPPEGAGWDSQAPVLYWTARHALGEELPDPRSALVDLVRHHVAASGPVSRRDLGWWSGAGLRQIDEALTALEDELSVRRGPDGLAYYDLVEGCPRPVGDVGVRLLPEYDALLLAYDPKARDRFADADALSYMWNKRNGVHSPTVLVDGRLRGRWQLDRAGGSATIAVETFPGERLLDPGDLTGPASDLAAVLGVTIRDVRASQLVPT
jgi:winged helix DNA-binding protein